MDINLEIDQLSKGIDKLPLKNGHIDFESSEFKRLSNKRAKLYQERRKQTVPE